VEDLVMSTASQPLAVRLRSGDVVRLRQVRPQDAPALARAYANLGSQSRYQRFFTPVPELSQTLLKDATEVDHENHEALVAVPLLSCEIVGECRFVRLADRPDTADLAVTVVDAWQGRGVGSALLARLSERALEAGIEYFTAEVLAENRTMLAMLPSLGRVETSSHGPVVSARIEIGEPPQLARQELRDLLAAAARAEILVLPTPLRHLVQVPGELAHVLRLPVTALLGALPPRLPATGRSGEEAGEQPGETAGHQ
jgi:RimJ/RimL family protein N-acetyltransferase